MAELVALHDDAGRPVGTADCPIRWQPGEVAWGDWVTTERVLAMHDELPFVPDTSSLMREWLEALVDGRPTPR